MRQRQLWFTLCGILTALALALVVLPAEALAASKYKVLYRFTFHDGGISPTSLTLDAAGNLYGTLLESSADTGGTVFKLTPNSQGGWTESTLYAFCSLANCADGRDPGGPLVFDGAGNLYGTTQLGGDFNYQPAYGCGTVFKLKPNADGSWTESVLHGFTGGADGVQPVVGVTFDAAGNLYGATIAGGPSNEGVVFRLKPKSDGSWTESVLYSLCSLPECADGALSFAGVIADAAGNLYGTASAGGDLTCNAPYGCGVVFVLKPNSDGSWTENLLYSFKGGADGRYPAGGLIFDEAGNLYSTTINGGGKRTCPQCGTVFKLKPNSDGSWTESLLHRFANNPAAHPFAGLTLDAAGNLYGTTGYGGPVDGGTVFKLKPNSDGSWAWHILHIFLGKPAAAPSGPLVLDKAGNLYGATVACDGRCTGVVYEITP